jgi:hypothetical protein
MKKQIISTLIAVVAPLAAYGAAPDAVEAYRDVRPQKIASVAPRAPVRHYALLGSMVFMAAGQMLDCASSINGHEINSMIGNGRDGRFNASRGFAIKGGIVAGIVAGEYVWHRRSGHAADAVMGIVNTTYGGIGVLAAAHNWGVKK